MSTLCSAKITSFITSIERTFRWTRSCYYFQQLQFKTQKQQQKLILVYNKKRKYLQQQQSQITSRNFTTDANNNNNKYNNFNNSNNSGSSSKNLLINCQQKKSYSTALTTATTTTTTTTAAAITSAVAAAAASTTITTTNNNFSRNYAYNSYKFINLHRQQRFSIFHKYKKVMDAPAGLFRGSVDRFNGITVESAIEYENNVDFAEKLEKSLNYWIQTKRRGIWFKILTEHCEWIPHLVKHEFEFHHAKNGFVVMYRWLPKNEAANIPVYAHTMVGVGGLVITDNDEVLVVSDRYAMIPGSWKLPGGFVEPREDLIDAAKREVKEETGVECTFKTLVSLRHTHSVGFGCSDFYIVVALKPKSLDLTRCDREILKCKWMPISEFLNHPHVHETNRHFMRTFLNYRRNNIRMICEQGIHQVLKKNYSLYFMQSDAAAPNENNESEVVQISTDNKSVENVKK